MLVWVFSLGSFDLDAFAWELWLGNCRVRLLEIFRLDVSLEHFSLETFAWDFCWELLLGSARLKF